MHILICIPTRDEYIHSRLMMSLLNLDLKNKYNIDYTINLKVGSLISRLRNEFVSDILYNTEYTHLLFIDSDLYDFEETLLKMINSNKKIIGGIYPKKTLREEYNINLLESIESTLQQPIFEVMHIATGLLLIHRSVFEEMIINYQDKRYINHDRAYFDLFCCFVKNEKYLSEDYGFCELYRNIGGKIYAVLDSKMVHNGTLNYHGDFKTFLKKRLGQKPN